jgi:hypothetical protein
MTRKGKRFIAIASVEDLEIPEQLEDRIDLDDARKALADVRGQGTVSWESIKRKLNL